MPAAFLALCSIQHQELGKACHLQEMRKLLALMHEHHCVCQLAHSRQQTGRCVWPLVAEVPAYLLVLTLCASACTLQAAAGTTRSVCSPDSTHHIPKRDCTVMRRKLSGLRKRATGSWHVSKTAPVSTRARTRRCLSLRAGRRLSLTSAASGLVHEGMSWCAFY